MSQETNNKEIKKNTKLTMPTAVVIAGVLIAGALLLPHLSGGKDAALNSAAQRTAAAAGDSLSLVNEVNRDDFVKGAKNPQVTIVEFSDFGCSFCSVFHPTLKTVVEENSDTVAWVYRHLPYRNMKAAQASECVGGRLGDEAFWEYSDVLFSAFPDITDKLMTSEALRLGFSSEEDLLECMESENINDAIRQDMTEAQLLGASGTPFSVILTDDGRSFPLKGATQLDQVRQIVNVLSN